MIAVLLSSVLSCNDANWILSGVMNSEIISAQHRLELIETIIESTDGSCVIDLPERS